MVVRVQKLLPAITICTSLFSELFYKDLKNQIRHGLTHIPDSKKALVGATIAQAEFGDMKEHNTTNSAGQSSAGGLVYPEYFPNWNNGIALQIAKEHKKLKGTLETRQSMAHLVLLHNFNRFIFCAFLACV